MKVGDKVNWVHWKATSKGFSGKKRTGIVEVMAVDSARIGVGRGVFYWCPLSMIRPADQPSALTDMFLGRSATQPAPSASTTESAGEGGAR
jgi:hypothetical protein